METNLTVNESASNRTLFVLNENFVQFYAISEFVSLIWTERYWEYGDFELEVLYDLDILDKVKVGHFVSLGDSSNIMVVESISITYEIDDKSRRYIVYKGRTLESMFDRRIVWGEWFYEEVDMKTIIFDLITKCIISPEDENRRISFFRIKEDSNVPENLLTLYGDGDVLYDIVRAICQEKQIGMKCSLIENAKIVEFSLYVGNDHSYDQLERAPVIFSSEYENLGPSRYSLDTTKFKTVALAVSPWRDTDIHDEEGNVIETETTRSMIEVGDFSVTGVNRREMFVSCGSGYPDDMAQEAMEEIADVNRLEELDSELDPKRQFIYGKDYTIGDTVQVITEFGLDAKAIVIEFIRSWSSDGYTEVPTFKILDGNNHILSGDTGGGEDEEPDVPVEPLFIDIPVISEVLHYNGDYQRIPITKYDDEYVYLAGTSTAINAGYYRAYAILRNPNNFWKDYTNEPKELGWKIEGIICQIPTFVESSFDYSGEYITPKLNDFNSKLMTMTGTLSAVNPGEYTIGIILDLNCQWTDGTTGIKYLTWKINKIKGSITLLDSGDVIFDDDEKTAMIQFIYVGGRPFISSISDGTVISADLRSVTSNLSEIGYFIYIRGLNYGTCDITICTMENDLYSQSDPVVIHVTFKKKDAWVPMKLPAGPSWRSVTYGNGRFVAVGYYSSYGAYSDDGINWTEMELSANRSWFPLAYGNGRFVAIGYNSSYGAYSDDGINWTQMQLPASRSWFPLAYGNGRFVAIAYNSSYGAYSDDGINWTQMQLPASAPWRTVAYGNGKFVAVIYGYWVIYYSDDGINWTGTETSLPGGSWSSVTYGNGRFVVVALGANYGAYSDDGINWTRMILPRVGDWYSVTYGNGRFVVVNRDSSYSAYSDDGINWTEMELPETLSWYSVTYGNGRFVTLASDSNHGAYIDYTGKE